MFIGRKKELEFLEERYSSGKAELIVLYGRRRIGKTETLRKFCEGKECVFYSCTEIPDYQQLQTFSSKILQKNVPAAKYLTQFSGWEQAFENMTEIPGTPKKLIVIDEFPYMVKSNYAIPSILQNLWDAFLKEKNIMIILCGSAMSFMEKEILAEKNPLYGRATGILKIKEMDFFDASEFFPNYTIEDKIISYAVLGGIPHYLQQFNSQKSIFDNIEKNIFTRGSILYSETEFLMKQELRETSVYNIIIAAVAMGNTKLNDIYQKTQIDKNKLVVYLKNLMDLGIIEKEFSISASEKEKGNPQRGLYQLADNYFKFWYAFVFPNLSELEAGDTSGIVEYLVKPKINVFVSRSFEKICIDYLRDQNKDNLLPFRFTSIGRFWNKTDEIDILGTDIEKTNLLIGECKYKNTPFDMGELNSVLNKLLIKTTQKAYYYLFSKNGYTEAVKNTAKEKNIVLVELDDLKID